MGYSNVVATLALIVSITAVPASGYLSYRFAIKGEKRKEFNVVADPIMESLMQQLAMAQKGHYPKGVIKQNQIDSVINVSDPKLAQKIQSAYDMYKDAYSECGMFVSKNYARVFDFHSPQILIKAIENLMCYVRHR